MESPENNSENRNTGIDPVNHSESDSNDSSESQFSWDEEFLYLFRTNDLPETAHLLNQLLVTDLNYKNAQGNTALHFTCANNLDFATYYLLKVLKVNYWVLNQSGNSPLQWAVQNKCVGAMKVLLSHDYDVNSSTYADKDTRSKEASWRLDKDLESRFQEQLKHITLNPRTIKHYHLEGYGPSYKADNLIEILHKNKFGKSILSEAFDCNNLEVLQLILEHPISICLDNADGTTVNTGDTDAVSTDTATVTSGTTSENTADGANTGSEEEVRYVLHELQFIPNASTSVRVRELAIENDRILNALESELDMSGQIIWEASIIASYWLSHLAATNAANADSNNLFRGKSVLELGTGCGLLGIALWVACEHHGQLPGKLTLTDLSERTLDNLRCNLALNGLSTGLEGPDHMDIDNCGNSYSTARGEVFVAQLNWKDFTVKEKYDVIIASDLVYDRELVKPLVNVITQLLDGLFLYTYKVSRDGADLFVEELTNAGFIVDVQHVSGQFQGNPFPGKSKDYCLMFFPDLESDDYNFLTASSPPHV
ncbi:ankyrin repeat containing protein [Theileria orientalis]|uniref:Ankyrin repeat containing protein n=1 Tax=Theileria orientalis TaxID=68886 RepID=A0A976M904_THEOR|nr:ankyrin repeat containing protein [Theileria orientalis]